MSCKLVRYDRDLVEALSGNTEAYCIVAGIQSMTESFGSYMGNRFSLHRYFEIPYSLKKFNELLDFLIKEGFIEELPVLDVDGEVVEGKYHYISR